MRGQEIRHRIGDGFWPDEPDRAVRCVERAAGGDADADACAMWDRTTSGTPG
jgi:hypothetical protein